MDALTFVTRPPRTVGPLYVLHGDELFLKRQVLNVLRERVVGPDADEQAVSFHAGDQATFAGIFDELDTLPFFFPRRFLVVDNADPFVTRYRADLERKVAQLPATATLVLDVKTWQSTTRLAKLVDSSATIVCKAPPNYKLVAWCSEWAQSRYEKQLPAQAAALLVELIGAEMGQLDQELLKLAVYVGKRARIDVADVDCIVGSSRAENVWKILDLAAAGNVKEALATLERLFDQGDAALMILGGLGYQLRKLAQAYRLTTQGRSLTAALEEAGVTAFAMRGAEQQFRQLGRRRLERIYDELLQMNVDLRSSYTLPERALFERFVIRLARKDCAEPRQGGGQCSGFLG
jgi:DNA polymerase III subunit delta